MKLKESTLVYADENISDENISKTSTFLFFSVHSIAAFE